MYANSTKLFENKLELNQFIKDLKNENKIIGFVPTMGALHEGHESLIKRATEECDAVIVSLFVNPTQFGPNEDFEKYPRQLEQDMEMCKKYGVVAVFSPKPDEMYSDRANLTMVVPDDFYKNKMCGISRKGHFDGVATVVLKLFNIVQPDCAYFGMKDAQQLFIIKKMVKDLDVQVNVIGCPIVRDEKGLALSSRNAYLSDAAKEKALTISKSLHLIKSEYINGNILDVHKAKELVNQTLDEDIELEYLEMYDYDLLSPVEFVGANTLIAFAGKINGVRLIDNILI